MMPDADHASRRTVPRGAGASAASHSPFRGIASDSRKVAPGFVFFAVPGTKADGMSFVPQAVAAGAVAVVGEAERPADLPACRLCARADVRRALALAAVALLSAPAGHDRGRHRNERQELGRRFHAPALRALGHKSASLGTLGVITSDGAAYGSLTTPDPISLHETLDRLARDGVTHLAMEASSHGIDQRRLDGVRLARGGLHQSRPRSSRLSRHDRSLCGREAAPVRHAAAERCAGYRQCRRALCGCLPARECAVAA